MELEGKIWRDGKFWLVEVPSLDIMTQGKTRKEAFMMIKDAVMTCASCNFDEKLLKKFELRVVEYDQDIIGITTNDNKLLLALSLIRQRAKSGSTIRDASKRLGSTSPNAYGVYEKGKINISLDKFEKLLYAANPKMHSHLRLVG